MQIYPFPNIWKKNQCLNQRKNEMIENIEIKMIENLNDSEHIILCTFQFISIVQFAF